MKRAINPLNKELRIYLDEKEYEKIKRSSQQSMCRSLSEYGRKILLRKTIKMGLRNRSADDAIDTNIQILQTLRAYLGHPSLSREDIEKLLGEISTIETLTDKIFLLCSRG